MRIQAATIRKAQQGDAEAFNEIVRNCQKRVLGTVYRLIGRHDDVEDVGQEVFVRVYLSLNQLRTVEVFESWLYRLTVNAAYDYLRKRRRNPAVPMAELGEDQVRLIDADESGQRYEAENRQAEAREVLNLLLDQVSEHDRMLLVLKEVEGLSLKQLKEIYGASEGAIKVRLFRARQRAHRAHEKLRTKGKNRPSPRPMAPRLRPSAPRIAASPISA